MTFIEFKKYLLDADLTLPKFANLIKVSQSNLQSYKKKGEVPNTIAVIVKSFALMHKKEIHFKEHIKELGLKKKKKDGCGFSSKKSKK
jgi:DNA-binding Xre family transcriptional regulator